MLQVKFLVADPSKGHLRSLEITSHFLPITSNQKEIEMWNYCQYPVKMHQLIYNMTYLGWVTF